jgi:hypothetical protein
LAVLAAPLLRTAGRLLAIKGSSVAAEVSAGWGAVQRAGMTADAALLAVVSAEGEASTGLPGVQITELSTWQPDGLLCEGEASKVSDYVPPAEPLALVLRLGRSGHRDACRR